MKPWETSLDLHFLDRYGHIVIREIETVGSLAAVTALVSFGGALIAVWTMQRTTALASWRTRAGRVLMLQRVFLAFTAMSVGLNALTPFITPDPPWLAMLPLVLAISFALLIFGLRYQPSQDP